jgi:hypothetical protein
MKREFKTEPWMAEFTQGRHSQEEWDAFFYYCEAGPVKRWFLRWTSVLRSIILASHEVRR